MFKVLTPRDGSRETFQNSCGSELHLSRSPAAPTPQRHRSSPASLTPGRSAHPDGLYHCRGPGQWKLSRHATMAPPSGAASYKKKDGILTLSQDEESLTWNPSTGSVAALTIPVSRITSMPAVLTCANRHFANDSVMPRFTADPRYGCQGDVEDFRTGCRFPSERHAGHVHLPVHSRGRRPPSG